MTRGNRLVPAHPPPDPNMPGYDDEAAVLDEAMRVLQMLNSAGKHTLYTIDRHVALTFRYEAVKENRKMLNAAKALRDAQMGPGPSCT